MYDVLVDGGHIHIFCSSRQLSKSLRVIWKIKIDVPGRSDASGKKMLKEPVFIVEKKPLVYILSPGV